MSAGGRRAGRRDPSAPGAVSGVAFGAVSGDPSNAASDTVTGVATGAVGGAAQASGGAAVLLRDCVRARPGERLLVVREPDDGGYYDRETPDAVARTARELALRVYVTEAPTALADEGERAAFVETLTGFDHVVFLARVGDQLRFDASARLPSATMCYALERDALDSAFGTACHEGLCAVRALVDAALAGAAEVRVSCPRGTDYRGRVASRPACASEDTPVKRFPMLVPAALPTAGFSGRVVLSRFLVGTGSHFYEPYWLALDDDVVARVAGDRLLRFEGRRADVARVNAHYADVAARYDVDPWCVHSWHAGIHPACRFERDAREDMLRWSGSAFGNPRILHFHTCGDYAPGEISWTVLDPTVHVDGVALWEDGRLHPERLAGGETLLARHPRLAARYREPDRTVGVGD